MPPAPTPETNGQPPEHIKNWGVIRPFQFLRRAVRRLLGAPARLFNAYYWRKIAYQEILRHADPRALTGTPPSDVRPHTYAKNLTRQTFNRSFSSPKWQPTPRAEVSVVLGTYNRIDALKLTIQSIRDNGLTRPYEIIVVDGGSTDGTVEWLGKQQDIMLVLQHNRDENLKRRRSWGYFMNLGFKLAEAKWVLMVSDDCLLLPGSIEQSLLYAQKLESEGRTVGGVAYYFRNWPDEERYFVQHTIGGMLMVNHGLFLRAALMDVNFIDEESYSFYKADSDLALKIWWNGYEIVACEKAVVEHLLLPSEQLRAANNQTMENDRLNLIKKWQGIYAYSYIPGLFKIQERRYLDFQDTQKVAELFRPLLEQEGGLKF